LNRERYVSKTNPTVTQAATEIGSATFTTVSNEPRWAQAVKERTVSIARHIAGRPTVLRDRRGSIAKMKAIARVQALALRVIADRLEHREVPAEFLNVSFNAA
jgi:predicted nicotinamide N-methyase